MNLKYVLDTNIVSEPLRPSPSRGVLQRMRRHDGALAIPAVVWHELHFGCARLPTSHRRAAIERYLEDVIRTTFPILEYDGPAAEWHARERARLEAAGRKPPFIDGQIAAIASVRDLILVTSDRAGFREFHGLRVEVWT